ncbi:hypothetical protein [Lysobacter sp. CA199]|uniref:hypothetical protein n=1 Tax=Lysobacter sp. CA199 TaxID=3455608 RepID=UPI003F8D1C48
MNRIIPTALLLSACLALSACVTGEGAGVAGLSPLCAQEYQQASERVQGGGEHAQEQRGAVYTHYVSPNCRQEQERLDKSQP